MQEQFIVTEDYFISLKITIFLWKILPRTQCLQTSRSFQKEHLIDIHTHTQKGKKRICNWLVEDLHLLKALKRKRNSFENSSPNVGCRDSFLKIKQLYKEGNNMVEIKVQFLFHLFDFGTFHALATYNLALPRKLKSFHCIQTQRSKKEPVKEATSYIYIYTHTRIFLFFVKTKHTYP